jgi:hypothetical protein
MDSINIPEVSLNRIIEATKRNVNSINSSFYSSIRSVGA